MASQFQTQFFTIMVMNNSWYVRHSDTIAQTLIGTIVVIMYYQFGYRVATFIMLYVIMFAVLDGGSDD